MRKVRCHECGKGYDYDQDDFCPTCGAYTQPLRKVRIDSDGTVVRVDGLNEENHEKSFLHRELHQEERQRSRVGLDWENEKKPLQGRPMSSSMGRQTKEKNPFSILVWIIGGIIALNFFNVLINMVLRAF